MAKKKRRTRSQKIAKFQSQPSQPLAGQPQSETAVEETEEFGYAKKEARHILLICAVFVALEFGLWVLFTHTSIETTLSHFLSI